MRSEKIQPVRNEKDNSIRISTDLKAVKYQFDLVCTSDSAAVMFLVEVICQ
jgi:hypothetical protein